MPSLTPREFECTAILPDGTRANLAGVKGMFMNPGYVKQIFGTSPSVLVDTRRRKLKDKELMLCAEDTAYGLISATGNARKIRREQLIAGTDKHGLSEEMIKKMWKRAASFYITPINFQPFQKPITLQASKYDSGIHDVEVLECNYVTRMPTTFGSSQIDSVPELAFPAKVHIVQ